jgi:protein-disulfide isomerase
MKKVILPIISFVLISYVFFGPLCAAGAEMKSTDMFLLTFGKGKTEVRLYSDYFCSACKAVEPNIEYLIADLVKRNVITITFIDTPLHNQSALYSRYFLYILNVKKEISHALKARSILFEAAQQNITDKEKLEAYLASKGIKFKIFDPQPVFKTLQQYLAIDRIRATPTCIVINGDKKDFYQGGPNITRALESLK